MNKKTIVAILVAVLLLLPITAFASYTISPTVVTWGKVDAGVVKVTGNADGSLTLNYMLKGWDGWCMTHSSAHVGLTPQDFPLSAIGALPKEFDYQYDFGSCVSSATRTIVDPVGDKQSLYMAIYVVVVSPEGQRQTAWVVGCPCLPGGKFPGRNGSTYFVFPESAWSSPPS